MIKENKILTEQQIEHFKTFGFLLLRGAFGSDDLNIINDEYEIGLKIKLEKDNKPRGARGQLNWSNLGPETPYLAKLPEDPRICGTAEQLLAEDAVALFSTANHFSGDRTPWHPDTDDPNCRSAKFHLYLQPLDENSGALRVIPGSHLSPFHDELHRIGLKGSNEGSESDNSYLNKSGLGLNDIPAHVCKSEPGDVILFHGRLWHATWKGSKDRRVVGCTFQGNPRTTEEKKSMQKMLEANRNIRIRNEPDDPQYHPHWLANPEKSPKRQQWINWLQEKGAIELAVK